MNVKPPFQNTEHKIKYAPKRGSSEYWYYLIFFVFLIPFILSSIVSGFSHLEVKAVYINFAYIKGHSA